MSETCADCKYYKPDEATWYFNGWGETPSTGRCFLEPLPAPRNRDDFACMFRAIKKLANQDE